MSLKESLRELPGIRALSDLRREVQQLRNDVRALRQSSQDRIDAASSAFVHQLLSDARYADPRHLARAELCVHSQSGEDGVIAEIFRRIGTTSRTFIEVGVESGVQCNTLLLLRQGWRGFWIEGSAEHAATIRRAFADELQSGQLTLIESMVSGDDAAALLQQAGAPTAVDLLSLDIDRNTWHLWHGLRSLRPRVAVVEYNASFGPTIDWVIDYRPDAAWNGTVNFGASLAAYERLGREQALALVGCGLNGTNAYFVERSLADAHFVGPFTSAARWEPPRYWLRYRIGHPTGPLRSE